MSTQFKKEDIVFRIDVKLASNLTSFLTASTFSACLLNMCFLTNSGPLNFFPDKGQWNFPAPCSSVFIFTNSSIDLNTGIVRNRI